MQSTYVGGDCSLKIHNIAEGNAGRLLVEVFNFPVFTSRLILQCYKVLIGLAGQAQLTRQVPDLLFKE